MRLLTNKRLHSASSDASACSEDTGVFLGSKSVVGKVVQLLSSRIWVESGVLVMSACDLRWPCVVVSASKVQRVLVCGKECAYAKAATDKDIQLSMPKLPEQQKWLLMVIGT